MKFFSVFPLFWAIFFWSSPTLAMDPQEIAVKIQQRYEQTQSLRAHFSQSTTIEGMAGRDRHAEGTLVVQKPGKLRWDYVTPDQQVLVCDGEEVIFYVAKQHQMLVSNAAQYLQEDLTYAFFMGQGKISTDFEIEALDAKLLQSSPYGLQLTPKNLHGQVKRLLVWVDDQFQITRLRITDHLQSINEISLSQIQINQPVADSFFLFVPPQGTEIVLQ